MVIDHSRYRSPSYTPPAAAPYLNPSTGAAVTSGEIIGGEAIAAEAAGVTTPLLAMSSVIPAVAGGYLAVRIGLATGNFIYKKWVDDSAPVTTATPALGTCYGAANTLPDGTSCPSSGSSITGVNGGNFICGIGTGVLFPGISCATWLQGAVALTDNSCTSVICTALQSEPGIKITNDGTATCWTGSGSSSSTGSFGAGACTLTIATEATLRKALHMESSTSTEYNSATNKRTMTPGSVSSSGAQNAANAVCASGNYTACNKYANGYRIAIEHEIDPNYNPTTGTAGSSSNPWVPIYLPQPLPAETLESYTERLRARTWVGLVTATSDSMAYPGGSPALQLQPGTVTAITVGTTTVTLYDPATGLPEAWPLNPPEITTSDEPISIQQVPPGYVPVATPGGGITVPPLNFSCQFPFGFICWAQDVTGWFNVAPQAPDFDFVIPDVTVGGHTYHVGSHYDVNLDVMDSYMSVFRSILSVVIWVGGIYWLAVRLLGFHPGGDPGEAIDDGMSMDGM